MSEERGTISDMLRDSALSGEDGRRDAATIEILCRMAAAVQTKSAPKEMLPDLQIFNVPNQIPRLAEQQAEAVGREPTSTSQSAVAVRESTPATTNLDTASTNANHAVSAVRELIQAEAQQRIARAQNAEPQSEKQATSATEAVTALAVMTKRAVSEVAPREHQTDSRFCPTEQLIGFAMAPPPVELAEFDMFQYG